MVPGLYSLENPGAEEDPKLELEVSRLWSCLEVGFASVCSWTSAGLVSVISVSNFLFSLFVQQFPYSILGEPGFISWLVLVHTLCLLTCSCSAPLL